MTENANLVGGNESEVNVAQLESEIRAKLQAEFDAEKNKILSNRDEILKEKKDLQERFKDVDVETLDKYRDFQKKVENDEMLRLASEGRLEELSQRMNSSQQKAWDEKSTEYEERLSVLGSKVGEYESLVEQMKNQNLDMRKDQYLKDLTATDDSFKGEYYGQFAQLYKGRMGIDENSGAVYALDESGNKMVNANGELETFQDFYSRQKVKDGLFWKVGSGSGHLDHGGSGDLGSKKISSMTSAEKAELRQEIGDKAFTDRLIAESRG